MINQTTVKGGNYSKLTEEEIRLKESDQGMKIYY